MKFTSYKDKGCVWIVQPGEYLIDTWDNKRCIERDPCHTIECDHCGKYYCLMTHWSKHLNTIAEERMQ